VALGQRVERDFFGERLVLRVHGENRGAAFDVGTVDDDLAIEAARTQQRRIEHVGRFRRGNQNDAGILIEAVHFDEQLVQGLFALVVTTAEAAPRWRPTASISSMNTMQGADFFACSKRSRTRLAPTADEHLHEIGTRDREERHAGLTGQSRGPAAFLPEPGGPSSSTPLGMRAPSA